ncbi:MAG: hypothetical protein LUQ38_09950, partial [Methanotrichaceae archaeon]|nr:hypothetical protein [Methanotrichaceae archaeon]
ISRMPNRNPNSHPTIPKANSAFRLNYFLQPHLMDNFPENCILTGAENGLRNDTLCKSKTAGIARGKGDFG